VSLTRLGAEVRRSRAASDRASDVGKHQMTVLYRIKAVCQMRCITIEWQTSGTAVVLCAYGAVVCGVLKTLEKQVNAP